MKIHKRLRVISITRVPTIAKSVFGTLLNNHYKELKQIMEGASAHNLIDPPFIYYSRTMKIGGTTYYKLIRFNYHFIKRCK
jgi:hypothetical protein